MKNPLSTSLIHHQGTTCAAIALAVVVFPCGGCLIRPSVSAACRLASVTLLVARKKSRQIGMVAFDSK